MIDYRRSVEDLVIIDFGTFEINGKWAERAGNDNHEAKSGHHVIMGGIAN